VDHQFRPEAGERVDLRIHDDDWLCAPEPPARFTPVGSLLEELRGEIHRVG
jgi:hypothetical protein